MPKKHIPRYSNAAEDIAYSSTKMLNSLNYLANNLNKVSYHYKNALSNFENIKNKDIHSGTDLSFLNNISKNLNNLSKSYQNAVKAYNTTIKSITDSPELRKSIFSNKNNPQKLQLPSQKTTNNTKNYNQSYELKWNRLFQGSLAYVGGGFYGKSIISLESIPNKQLAEQKIANKLIKSFYEEYKKNAKNTNPAKFS